MARILEQLYVGNLRPNEEKHEKFDECQQLMEQMLTLTQCLSKIVSVQEQKSVTYIVDLIAISDLKGIVRAIPKPRGAEVF